MTIKFMFNFPNDANHTYMLVQIKSGIPNLWRRYYRTGKNCSKFRNFRLASRYRYFCSL